MAQYDGAYKISKGLFKKYGEKRIWDTPITEPGFTGLACGAALMGLKPIVEFMSYMSGGELRGGSIVFRGLNGPAAAVAAQHSQCFASYYSNIPGLITVSPYDAEDCKGLLKASIRCGNPVAFL